MKLKVEISAKDADWREIEAKRVKVDDLSSSSMTTEKAQDGKRKGKVGQSYSKRSSHISTIVSQCCAFPVVPCSPTRDATIIYFSFLSGQVSCISDLGR